MKEGKINFDFCGFLYMKFEKSLLVSGERIYNNFKLD